jgi:hypothetical protein
MSAGEIRLVLCFFLAMTLMMPASAGPSAYAACVTACVGAAAVGCAALGPATIIAAPAMPTIASTVMAACAKSCAALLVLPTP